MLLKLSPLPRFYRGNQCKFPNSCLHYRRYLGKSENLFPITAVGNTVQVSSNYVSHANLLDLSSSNRIF